LEISGERLNWFEFWNPEVGVKAAVARNPSDFEGETDLEKLLVALKASDNETPKESENISLIVRPSDTEKRTLSVIKSEIDMHSDCMNRSLPLLTFVEFIFRVPLKLNDGLNMSLTLHFSDSDIPLLNSNTCDELNTRLLETFSTT
jgi:hypothetical protein